MSKLNTPRPVAEEVDVAAGDVEGSVRGREVRFLVALAGKRQ